MDRTHAIELANAMLAIASDDEICEKLGLSLDEVVELRALRATAPSSAAARAERVVQSFSS